MAALVPDLPKVEQHIVDLTNQVRREKNLSSLKVNAILTKAARAYAQRLARTDQFSHTADGRSPSERVESAGYKFCAIAENLAMDRSHAGFDTGQLALQALAGWMNSPPHRANILMAGATEIGVGVARGPGAVPKFISVELLGRPASSSLTFEIANLSKVTVTFAFQDRSRDLKSRMSIVQHSCAAGIIKLSKPGGFFSSASGITQFPAKDGTRYTLKSDANGSLSVVIGARAN